MRSRFVLLAAALSLAVLSTGCLDMSLWDFGQGDDSASTSDGRFNVSSASLTGAIGPLSGLNDVATAVRSNGWADSETLEIVVNRGFDAAMTIIDIEGGLDHPALQPGAVLTFDGNSFNNNAYDGLNFRVTGCSGESEGDWDYDEPAEEVEVEVEEVPSTTGNPNDPDRPRALALTVTSRFAQDCTFCDPDWSSRATEVVSYIVIEPQEEQSSEFGTANDDPFVRPITD